MHASTVLLASLLLLALAPGVPTGGAQAVGPQLYVLHDATDDGFTYVGSPNHFGFALLQDGQTTTHEQGCIRVEQNDRLLYQTTPDSGHDYDVLNTFQFTFDEPGPYLVSVGIPRGDCAEAALTAEFSGVVVDRATLPQTEAHVDLFGFPAFSMNAPTQFSVRVKDEAGNRIPHADVEIEIRRPVDDWLVFRTHLHGHDGEASFQYLFPETGTYDVRAVAYLASPTPQDAAFPPVAAHLSVDVGPASASLVAPATPGLRAAVGTSPYVLLTGLDPQARNAPVSRTVLSALVYDTQAQTFVPHVDFEAVLADASGRVIYASNTLHEYDGLYDVVFHWPIPGTYTLSLSASTGAWVGRVDLELLLAEQAPPTPTGVGVVVLTAGGLEDLRAREAASLVFQSRTLAGTEAQHSEIDLQVFRLGGDAAPFFQNKIHTHETGRFDIDLAFPEPGTYRIVLDPVTIHGDPTVQYYYGSVGGALAFDVEVGGTKVVTPPTIGGDRGPEDAFREMPGPGLVGALLVLALAVAFRRNHDG